MRIAVLATSRHPIAEPFTGGQESMTAGLVRGLRERGHHLRLYAVSGTDPGLADELVTFPGVPPLSAVAAVDPQLPEPDFLRDQVAYLSAIADLQARADVDVVHNQSLNYLPPSLSAVLSAPMVTTLHTPPFPWMELGAMLASPRARFVAVSEATARQWSTLATPPQVIHNAIRDDGAGPGSGGDGLVWSGRLTADKGADLAVRAARRAGRRLALAGPVSDPDWYGTVLAPMLGDGVEHVGHLRHEELADLTRASAAALVTPRWDEPFGLVAAEAACWGTPVVAIARGGLPEVLGPGLGVLVAPADDEEQVVAGLAAGVAAVGSLVRAEVRQAALAAFSHDRMVTAYERLFASLIGTKNDR